MSTVFAAYSVQDQLKDTTFSTQRGHVEKSPLPALEYDVSTGARTTELAVSTDFRPGDDTIANVLGCLIFYASEAKTVV
jgi:hypothetical protein